MGWLIGYGIGAALMALMYGMAHADDPSKADLGTFVIVLAAWPLTLLLMLGVCLGSRK